MYSWWKNTFCCKIQIVCSGKDNKINTKLKCDVLYLKISKFLKGDNESELGVSKLQ